MPIVDLLCPKCDFPIEGPDDATDETIVTCANPLSPHSFKLKDAVDQMAKRIESKIASDTDSMFKKGGV
jgi:hypothetical protein